MSALDPITKCRTCGAELPPFTNDCPHCGLSWRDTLTEPERRQERRLGCLAAGVWVLVCLALLIADGFHAVPDAALPILTIGAVGGFPGLFVILILFGRSRNKGYAALDGCGIFFLWVILAAYLCCVAGTILSALLSG